MGGFWPDVFFLLEARCSESQKWVIKKPAANAQNCSLILSKNMFPKHPAQFCCLKSTSSSTRASPVHYLSVQLPTSAFLYEFTVCFLDSPSLIIYILKEKQYHLQRLRFWNCTSVAFSSGYITKTGWIQRNTLYSPVYDIHATKERQHTYLIWCCLAVIQYWQY